MFTGLVEKVGKLKSLRRGKDESIITVSHDPWTDPLKKGESVAVQGACLTVVDATEQTFTCNILDETLNRTNLATKKPDADFNLERAIKVGDRMGGHILTGHVDGVGRVLCIATIGGDRVVRIECNQSILQGIVMKGSVGCDGVSLTVSNVLDRAFEVRIIPFTWKHTSLRTLRDGSSINIESDVLGKYASRNIHASSRPSEIDMDLLSRSGFA
jgi:riboflavin synthase